MNYESILSAQKEFFISNATIDLNFRKSQLRKLKAVLKENEKSLFEAIYTDFKKSSFETYMTELGLIYHEIDLALSNLSEWASEQSVSTNLANFPGRSFIIPEPFGNCLVIGAWNYPYQLTLVPVVSALAAGNTALIKPSEAPVQTANLIQKLINENFDPRLLYVVNGEPEVSQKLLELKYDKIFFTGSTAVGKIVASAAAKHLTPTTLELGGKSPCLVMDDVPIKRSAQRIVWGKFLNSGQTCIAPDYVLVHTAIYEEFLSELKNQIKEVIGDDPKKSEAYVRIINDKHWQRLTHLIDPKKVIIGGDVDKSDRYIAPTVLKDISFNDEIMNEEIFGPLLPIIPFNDLNLVIREIQTRPKPLALYIFSNTKKVQEKVLSSIRFGGGAINEVIMHISNPDLPFGGVGHSGSGNYHGLAGFKTFSHYKSILKKPFWFEPPMKYRPFSKWKELCLRFLLG